LLTAASAHAVLSPQGRQSSSFERALSKMAPSDLGKDAPWAAESAHHHEHRSMAQRAGAMRAAIRHSEAPDKLRAGVASAAERFRRGAKSMKEKASDVSGRASFSLAHVASSSRDRHHERGVAIMPGPLPSSNNNQSNSTPTNGNATPISPAAAASPASTWSPPTQSPPGARARVSPSSAGTPAARAPAAGSPLRQPSAAMIDLSAAEAHAQPGSGGGAAGGAAGEAGGRPSGASEVDELEAVLRLSALESARASGEERDARAREEEELNMALALSQSLADAATPASLLDPALEEAAPPGDGSLGAANDAQLFELLAPAPAAPAVEPAALAAPPAPVEAEPSSPHALLKTGTEIRLEAALDGLLGGESAAAPTAAMAGAPAARADESGMALMGEMLLPSRASAPAEAAVFGELFDALTPAAAPAPEPMLAAPPGHRRAVSAPVPKSDVDASLANSLEALLGAPAAPQPTAGAPASADLAALF
jgi:hypothetical protein